MAKVIESATPSHRTHDNAAIDIAFKEGIQRVYDHFGPDFGAFRDAVVGRPRPEISSNFGVEASGHRTVKQHSS